MSCGGRTPSPGILDRDTLDGNRREESPQVREIPPPLGKVFSIDDILRPNTDKNDNSTSNKVRDRELVRYRPVETGVDRDRQSPASTSTPGLSSTPALPPSPTPHTSDSVVRPIPEGGLVYPHPTNPSLPHPHHLASGVCLTPFSQVAPLGLFDPITAAASQWSYSQSLLNRQIFGLHGK